MDCIGVELIDVYIHPVYNEQAVYVGRKWKYRAFTNDGTIVTEDMEIYISYVGSTAIYGTSFTGPKKVIIPIGYKYIDFDVEIFVHESSYKMFINVSGTTEIFRSCNTDIIQILSEKSTPTIPTPENPTPENPLPVDTEPGVPVVNPIGCCSYYDSTHIEWNSRLDGCDDNNGIPQFPGNLKKDGTESAIAW